METHDGVKVNWRSQVKCLKAVIERVEICAYAVEGYISASSPDISDSPCIENHHKQQKPS